MPFVKAQCTNCGAALEVDPSKEAAVCPYCNTPYIVEKAINNYVTNVTNNIQAQNVTIVGGKDFNQIFNSAKALLDVSHKQGLEACNEALSLQPTNYEVWALRAKYAINGFMDVNQAIQKVNELTPSDVVADVSKDIMTYLVDFCKRIKPNDAYTALGTNYLTATKLTPEDSVYFADEILGLMNKELTFIKSIGSYVAIMNEVIARKEEDFEKCSQEYKAEYSQKSLATGALCKGAEQIVFENGGSVFLFYRGKQVNKEGFFSAPRGTVTLTNYKITYETGSAKSSFSKTLESLSGVTTQMMIMIKLTFSDGYEVQMPSPSKTADDANQWVDTIKKKLF